MAIVSSSHALDAVRADGRRECIEDHLDHVGVHHLVRYLAAVGADYVAIRTARAALIAEMLIDGEIQAALLVDASPVLVYAEKTDFVPVMREAYRTATRDECARLATWIINRVNDAWVTETQVRNAFGLDAGQWATLRAKMIALRDNYLAVQAAAGE
jgi:hypothetical protein